MLIKLYIGFVHSFGALKMSDKVHNEVRNCKGVPDYSFYIIRKKTYETALVIPVINEGGRILQQIKNIRSENPLVDIIIADGGSTDGTIERLTNQSSGVVSILIKKGPGKLSAQLRMAFHYCLENDYKYVITMDGNNKDGPEGIEKIRRALESGFDFVQGSRFILGGEAVNTPKKRSLAIRYVHAPITSFAAGRRFTDTTNGFRGLSRRLIESKDIGIYRDVFQSYELVFYLPIRATKMNYRVTEVAVRRNYPSNGPTPTKIIGVFSYLNLIQILLKASIGRYNP